MNSIIEQIKTIAEDTVKTVTEKAEQFRGVAVENGNEWKTKAVELSNEWKTKATEASSDLYTKVTNTINKPAPTEVVETVAETTPEVVEEPQA